MENIQEQKQSKRPKTGGRQKGTPNKVSASVKLFIKNILLDPQNIEAYRRAFLEAKPEALIAHYEKMMRFICAPQSNKDNGGEWLPDDNMDLEWPTFMERRQDAIYEKSVAQEEAFKESQIKAVEMAFEMDSYRRQYYKAGAQVREIFTNNEFMQQIIRRCGEDNFFKGLNDLYHQLTLKTLQQQGIQPPQTLSIAEHIVEPTTQQPSTENAETTTENNQENNIDDEVIDTDYEDMSEEEQDMSQEEDAKNSQCSQSSQNSQSSLPSHSSHKTIQPQHIPFYIGALKSHRRKRH